MTPRRLLEYLVDLGIQIDLDGERLRVRAAQGIVSPEIRDRIARSREELLSFLQRREIARARIVETIPVAPRDGPLPLSFVQQQLLFLDRLEESSSHTYNVPYAMRLTGALRVEVLRRALDEIFNRHEILRVRVADAAGEAVHVITDRSAFPILEEDLSGEVDPEAALEQRLAEAAFEPFDLASGPLCRATLFRCAEDSHVLLVTMHHIITDGWSVGLFEAEFSDVYGAIARGVAVRRPAPGPDYLDYAHHEQHTFVGDALESELEVWQDLLEGAAFELELPTDFPRPELPSFRGTVYDFRIDDDLNRRIAALGRAHGATTYMTLMAAFNLLLFKYTGKVDLLVGSPFANRTREAMESTMGFFVNTVAIRTDLSGNPTFAALLDRVRDHVMTVYEHANVPMGLLAKRLNVPVDLSRNPLFQVTFALQSAPRTKVELPGVRVESLRLPLTAAKFDLSLIVTEKDAYSACSLDYSTDLFEDSTVRRMAGHFLTLLEAIVARPDAPISELSVLPEAELHRTLVEWNATETDFPRDRRVKELFEEVAASSPDAIALRFGGAEVSYGELNRRANHLAHRLIALGTGPDMFLGICAERSVELVVGILAILKAGGAYVPLDPAYPSERLSFMIRDSGMRAVLVQRALASSLPNDGQTFVEIDAYASSVDDAADENPDISGSATDLVFLIYTSGSTGRPKGVQTENRGLVRLVRNTNLLDLETDETFLLNAPMTFDGSALEMWAALLNGHTLAISPPGWLTLNELGEAIQQMGVTTLYLTAGLFRLMVDERVDDLAGVRCLMTGGDVVSPASASRLKKVAPDLKLIDTYGPTECSVTATWHVVDDASAARVRIPIGKPISNTTAYILDAALNPVPVGIPGELYLGGPGLARGYHNRPDLAERSFIHHPFSDVPGERLYRTGDRCKWLPDGAIDFLGRFDDQIKIRGFRIEPSEIELILNEHPSVLSSVVLAQVDPAGDKALVAYAAVDAGKKASPEELLAYLSGRLPGYMVPTAAVCLDAFPRTSANKIDRTALENPLLSRTDTEESFRAPANPVEKTVASIWEDVLGGGPYALGDDFFGQGGHSLLALKVLSRLERQFGIRISIRALFEHTTLEAIADHVSDGLNTAPSAPQDDVTELII